MTEKKNYPEEIYETRDGLTMTLKQRDGHGGRVRRRAYDLGFRDGRFKERLEASNPRAGWSNLTDAIKAGERIDWDALDGIEAKCVHPELGVLTYKMERFRHDAPNHYLGWASTSTVWDRAFDLAWQGESGWSLWVKADLPLRKLTADELEPGTCFYGKLREVTGTFFIFINSAGIKRAYSLAHSDIYEPEKVEVLEVYGIGTFDTTGEDA